MANQLGTFIPDLAILMTPIRLLLRKDVAWTWEEPQQTAFTKVKTALTQLALSHYYDSTLPTTIVTDASKLHGMGFVLMQTLKGGQTAMIQCGSRTFTQAEKNYAPIEQECLAIQWSIERCRHYLLGNPGFKVITLSLIHI